MTPQGWNAFELTNAWLDCHINFILQCNIWSPRHSHIIRGAPMSEDWNTKYGPRRVRRDPPTLQEAIFAAKGLTDSLQQQAEIAASLMGLPVENVKTAHDRARPTRTIASDRGMRSVVVERISRRPARHV